MVLLGGWMPHERETQKVCDFAHGDDFQNL